MNTLSFVLGGVEVEIHLDERNALSITKTSGEDCIYLSRNLEETMEFANAMNITINECVRRHQSTAQAGAVTQGPNLGLVR